MKGNIAAEIAGVSYRTPGETIEQAYRGDEHTRKLRYSTVR